VTVTSFSSPLLLGVLQMAWLTGRVDNKLVLKDTNSPQVFQAISSQEPFFIFF
jgi:hypothetical protein